MDSWLQRLVVRGTAADVAAFRKAAASPSKPHYFELLFERARQRTQKLSFIRLRALLPSRLADGIDEPQEPWDLVIEPPHRFRDGTIEITYRFQLNAFECENLIIAVSTIYPRLCFVLGVVDPAGDEQSSMMVHAGRVWRWRISNRLKESICAKIPEDTEDNEDEVFWALVEADCEMMDEVVNHWKEKVSKIVSNIKRELKLRRRHQSLAKAALDRTSTHHRASRGNR
jgi:hypothetical protein